MFLLLILLALSSRTAKSLLTANLYIKKTNIKNDISEARNIAQKVKDALFEYLQFLSADQNEGAEDKGYTFFKKIEPYLS